MMNITDIQVKKVNPESIATMSKSQEELTFFKQALDYVKKGEFLNKKAVEHEAYSAAYTSFSKEEEDTVNKKPSNSIVEQEIQFLKYNDQLRVNIIKSKDVENQNTLHVVSVIELDKESGIKRAVLFMNGELVDDNVTKTDEKELTIPAEFDQLSQEEIATDEEVISVQGLPCIQDGCCSFRYNGNPFNPLVKYNWCGANCGSGTPVNALDRCCMYHDGCYDDNKSYPARCGCDRILLSCANLTDNAGTSRLMTAFTAKMVAQGCSF